MNHPQAPELALHASGDLPFWRGIALRWHLLGCDACRREVEAHQEVRENLRGAAGDLPEDLDWSQVSAEMHANIRLGLEAGACVGETERVVRRRDWRAAVAMAAALVVAVAAWWLHGPGPSRPAEQAAVSDDDIVLAATAAGVEIKQAGGALALRHPNSNAVTVTVSVGGTARAGYVDDDAGQVTINHVYAQ